MPGPSTTGSGAGTATPPRIGGRAHLHRRVGIIPLGYLAAIVAVGVAHPFVPQWRWLLVHLLLLGAATNAIVVWSTHFANAVLRVPPPSGRRGEAVRLAVLNVGVAAVLVSGAGGGDWYLLALAGSVVVFAAVLGHLIALAARLRKSLSPPLAGSVHYYLAASVALLIGIPAGAWMLVVDNRAPVLLFHAHVNVLGWITLTVLGTLLTLWPTRAAHTGRVHRITLRAQEVERKSRRGVRQESWTFNGTTPGPVLRGRVGDLFEVTLLNDGSIDHGIGFHAGALAPDRPMRPVEPGSNWSIGSPQPKPGSGCITAPPSRCCITWATACTER